MVTIVNEQKKGSFSSRTEGRRNGVGSLHWHVGAGLFLKNAKFQLAFIWDNEYLEQSKHLGT